MRRGVCVCVCVCVRVCLCLCVVVRSTKCTRTCLCARARLRMCAAAPNALTKGGTESTACSYTFAPRALQASQAGPSQATQAGDAQAAPKKLTKNEMESTLRELIGDGWLASAPMKRGHFCLGVGAGVHGCELAYAHERWGEGSWGCGVPYVRCRGAGLQACQQSGVPLLFGDVSWGAGVWVARPAKPA